MGENELVLQEPAAAVEPVPLVKAVQGEEIGLPRHQFILGACAGVTERIKGSDGVPVEKKSRGIQWHSNPATTGIRVDRCTRVSFLESVKADMFAEVNQRAAKRVSPGKAIDPSYGIAGAFISCQ
jgi:hypothetical protein